MKLGNNPAPTTSSRDEDTLRVVVPDLVEIWTFQPKAFYTHLCKHGVSWQPDPAVTDKKWHRPNSPWKYAYHWLVERMHAQGVQSPVTPAPHYPVWGWFWWWGDNMKQPNLRYYSSWSQRKKNGSVLLKLLVPKENVCISHFHAWNNVTSPSYFGLNEADDDEFYRQVEATGFELKQLLTNLPQGSLRDKLFQSWERIFDVNAPPDDWLFEPFEKRCLQATLFAVTRDQVAEAWWLPKRGKGRKKPLPLP